MNCEESEKTSNKQNPFGEIKKRFLEERKVFLWGAVDGKSSAEIVEQLIY